MPHAVDGTGRNYRIGAPLEPSLDRLTIVRWATATGPGPRRVSLLRHSPKEQKLRGGAKALLELIAAVRDPALPRVLEQCTLGAGGLPGLLTEPPSGVRLRDIPLGLWTERRGVALLVAVGATLGRLERSHHFCHGDLLHPMALWLRTDGTVGLEALNHAYVGRRRGQGRLTGGRGSVASYAPEVFGAGDSSSHAADLHDIAIVAARLLYAGHDVLELAHALALAPDPRGHSNSWQTWLAKAPGRTGKVGTPTRRLLLRMLAHAPSVRPHGTRLEELWRELGGEGDLPGALTELVALVDETRPWRQPGHGEHGEQVTCDSKAPEQVDEREVLEGRWVVERELRRPRGSVVYLCRRRHGAAELSEELYSVERVGHEDSEQEARFARKVELLRELDHPCLPKIAEYSAGPDGCLTATPYAQGETLAVVLAREGKLAEGRALAVGNQLASALAYCHRQGVHHRNLCLESVLLLEDGGVQLLGFGYSRKHLDPRLTTVGWIGDPPWMPPEAVFSTSVDARLLARRDCYALGLILFIALTGRDPFGELRERGPRVVCNAKQSTGALDPGLGFHRQLRGLIRSATCPELGRALCEMGSFAGQLTAIGTPVVDPRKPRPRPATPRATPVHAWAAQSEYPLFTVAKWPSRGKGHGESWTALASGCRSSATLRACLRAPLPDRIELGAVGLGPGATHGGAPDLELAIAEERARSPSVRQGVAVALRGAVLRWALGDVPGWEELGRELITPARVGLAWEALEQGWMELLAVFDEPAVKHLLLPGSTPAHWAATSRRIASVRRGRLELVGESGLAWREAADGLLRRQSARLDEILGERVTLSQGDPGDWWATLHPEQAAEPRRYCIGRPVEEGPELLGVAEALSAALAGDRAGPAKQPRRGAGSEARIVQKIGRSASRATTAWLQGRLPAFESVWSLGQLDLSTRGSLLVAAVRVGWVEVLACVEPEGLEVSLLRTGCSTTEVDGFLRRLLAPVLRDPRFLGSIPASLGDVWWRVLRAYALSLRP